MEWYLKLMIYFISIIISMFTMYQIDFNKFMRMSKSNFAILVWIIISLALGYLIGSLFIAIGEQLRNI